MTTSNDSDRNAGVSIWRLLPIAVLVFGLAAFFVFDLDVYLSFDALSENRDFLSRYVAENFVTAALIYTIGYVIVVAFSLPGGAILSLTGGFLFGILTGCILTVVGATVGATALFIAAKTAFGEVLHAKAGSAVTRMSKGFRENAFSYLLFLRLIPVFPFWLVNLVPALLNIRLSVYVLATFIGIIPGTVVYVSVGNGLGAVLDAGRRPDLGIIFDLEILLPLIGLALLSLLPIVYKRFRGGANGDPS